MFLNVKKYRFFLFTAAIVFIFFNNSSLCKPSEYEVKIEYKVSGKQLTIEGTFINYTMNESDVSYNLRVDKQSKAGNSSTAQSGQIKVPADSEKILSQCVVDFSLDAVYKIHLVVQSGQIILADKELVLKGSEIQKH